MAQGDEVGVNPVQVETGEEEAFDEAIDAEEVITESE